MINSAEFGLTHSPFFLLPAFQKKKKEKLKTMEGRNLKREKN